MFSFRSLITAMSFWLPAMSASGAEFYYVELGSKPSQEQAADRWEELSKQYKDQLGALQYYPASVFESPKKSSVRIVAGPIETKDEAQVLCKKLFEKDVPCFVIEGLQSPPTLTVAKKAPPKPLPWLVENKIEAETIEPLPPKEEPGFFGRLFTDDDDADKAAPAVKIDVREADDLTPKEAKVVVAEAIRVPESNVPEIVSPNFQTEPASAEPLLMTPQPSGEVKVEVIGWLNVRSFENAESAATFWQNVRAGVPALAAGLRVRINQPAAARSGHKTVLNIGPFGSEADALAFCEKGITPIDAELRCQFSTNEPRNSARPVASKPGRSNDYEARRKATEAQRRAQDSNNPFTPTMRSGSGFWVQLVSGEDQEEVVRQWDSLKEKHADLFEGMNRRVISSSGKKAGYVVRVGPIATQSEAAELCQKLQGESSECRIFQNK